MQFNNRTIASYFYTYTTYYHKLNQKKESLFYKKKNYLN